MKTLNENELGLATGGVICYTPPTPKLRAEIDEEKRLAAWKKWVASEKQKLEGLADIRMRAADNALKAAMRVRRAEAEIKAAMRAEMGME